MPELPEVESIKLQLQKYLVGHTLEKVEVKNPRLWTGDVKDVEGAKVKDIRRFAKVLSIDLSSGYSIVIHIKLTGQLLYRGPNLKNPPELSKKVLGGIPGPHTHVIFHLDNGGFLYYNDVRRFGWLKVVETAKLEEQNEFVAKLGPEPFKDLTKEKFVEILKKGNRPVKILIMDQAKMGGIGNIYANDALWKASLNPETKAKEIPEKKMKELYEAILSVMKEGMKYGGASELAFVTPDGQEGGYQRHTLAYGHEGMRCERCGKGVFEKYFLGGRGTYVCRVCQK